SSPPRRRPARWPRSSAPTGSPGVTGRDRRASSSPTSRIASSASAAVSSAPGSSLPSVSSVWLDLPEPRDENDSSLMPGFLTRLFGSANERMLRRLWPVVEEINGLEESYRALPDEAFPEKTAGFRQRLAEVEAEDAAAAALEEILPEAFAAVREASRRTIGLRHFDVQLLGGIVLHEGKIAEMKTGE